jgi:cellulose synthase (UDP-forming)
LRRSDIDLVGGIRGQSVVEDAETALELHSMGKRSAYVNRPMVAGLQPETCAGFITQRVRWAQGMLQILIFKNPLRQKKLSLAQKLCYFNSSFFWLFCFARLVFLVAPAMYLVFGCQVYDANGREFIAYAVPHVLASIIVSDYLYGKIRWPLVSTLYEVLQSVYCFKGIVSVLRSPRSPTFKVTPKGETTDRDAISQVAGPFWVLYAVTLVALAMGVWRWFEYPEHHDVTAVTMAWELANLSLLHATLGALYERRQVRQTHRMPARIPASLESGGIAVPCLIRDVSVGGARIELSAAELPPADRLVLRVAPSERQPGRSYPIDVRHRAKPRGGKVSVGVRFAGADPDDVVALVHGDSRRWMSFRASRKPSLGFFARASLIFRAGGRAGFHHHLAFLRLVVSLLAGRVSTGADGAWKRAVAFAAARTNGRTPGASPPSLSPLPPGAPLAPPGRPHPTAVRTAAG